MNYGVEWAAGLFEGEGSFYLHRSNSQARQRDGVVIGYDYPMASLSIRDLDVITKFHEVIGCGKVKGPYAKGGNRQPIYIWDAFNKEALKAIAILKPYMMSRRTEQIDRVLATAGKTEVK